MVTGLQKLGWQIYPGQGTFYLWIKVPGGNSLEFCSQVLEKTGVLLTPGVGFGPGGEGYFRISLTCPQEDLEKALEKLQAVSSDMSEKRKAKSEKGNDG